jgi:thymidylate synthase ThyX
MKPEAYERTLKARAFDVARYLLPLATNTSLGQIVNARTLETQVSRLLSHPSAEVRDLGARLRDAATGPAWNVNEQAGAALVEKIAAAEKLYSETPSCHEATSQTAENRDGSQASYRGTTSVVPQGAGYGEGALAPEGRLAAEAANLLTREVRTAPTLVKYAQPSDYEIQTRAELTQAAAELLRDLPIADAPVVDLVEPTEALEVELAATLLYSVSHHPYRQIRSLIAELPEARVSEIIELGLRHRGKHDEALRAFHAGAALRFDILMDIGGFRDMHRHRRCTQIAQSFTTLHGYETPMSGDLAGDANILAEAGVLADYQAAIEAAHKASARIAASQAPEAAQSALYLLPLATRTRSLFKMDFAEAQYIAELRSAPAGHFSYRRVAWEMFLALKRQHPSLAAYIRVTDFTKPIDLLQR